MRARRPAKLAVLYVVPAQLRLNRRTLSSTCTVRHGRQLLFVKSYKMSERGQQFARMSPIVPFQGAAEIRNNHPADSVGTTWLTHELLGEGCSPDVTDLLVFRDRENLILFQAAHPNAVLSGDIHTGLQDVKFDPHPTPFRG
jgi:hypothetical protein